VGRPRGFDETVVLDAAERAFWSGGYEATSLASVSRASGVGNGSLYAAYASKLNLFLVVFERYCAGRVRLVSDVMATPGSVAEVVDRFLEVIVDDCVAHSPSWGCLMLNSIAEIGLREPEVASIGSRTIAEMESHVADRLRAAREVEPSSIGDDELDALAAHVVLVSQGLIQLSRVEGSRERLRSIAEESTRLVAARWAA